MSAPLVTLLLLLGALVGFAVGWVAKRDFARAYVEANTRYWQARLAEVNAEVERLSGLQLPQPAAPATTTVVQHFHMTPPSWPTPAPVIDAQIVRALPGGEVA